MVNLHYNVAKGEFSIGATGLHYNVTFLIITWRGKGFLIG